MSLQYCVCPLLLFKNAMQTLPNALSKTLDASQGIIITFSMKAVAKLLDGVSGVGSTSIYLPFTFILEAFWGFL